MTRRSLGNKLWLFHRGSDGFVAEVFEMCWDGLRVAGITEAANKGCSAMAERLFLVFGTVAGMLQLILEANEAVPMKPI